MLCELLPALLFSVLCPSSVPCAMQLRGGSMNGASLQPLCGATIVLSRLGLTKDIKYREIQAW